MQEGYFSYLGSFKNQFINPYDEGYRPYYGIEFSDDYELWEYRRGGELKEQAGYNGFQNNEFTEMYGTGVDTFEDEYIHPCRTFIRDNHINQLRHLIEHFSTIIIRPCYLYEGETAEYGQGRYITVFGYGANLDAAWTDAKANLQTEIAADNWSAWSSGYLIKEGIINCMGGYDGEASQYYVNIVIREFRCCFDLDLEISDMGWNVFPPLSAKLVAAGGRIIQWKNDNNWTNFYETEFVTEDTPTSCIKCVETDTATDLGKADYDVSEAHSNEAGIRGIKASVIDADVTDLCGIEDSGET